MSVTVTSTIRMRDDVPVRPFRERFLELQERGLTAGDVAVRLGWYEGERCGRRKRPDSQRVRRVLGFVPRQDRNRVSRIQQYVTLSTAAQLAEALELDPWEIGL